MTATTAIERLRELLDERGVKHVGNGGMTRWTNEHGCVCRAFTRLGDQSVDVAILGTTPEQAVAATLGCGTCRNVSNTPSGFLCSECGWGDFDESSHLLTTSKFTDNDGGPNYCPNCGREVVDE